MLAGRGPFIFGDTYTYSVGLCSHGIPLLRVLAGSVRESGGYRLNRSPDPTREPGGGGRRGSGASSTAIRSVRPLRKRSPRALMALQWVCSRPITSGSRR